MHRNDSISLSLPGACQSSAASPRAWKVSLSVAHPIQDHWGLGANELLPTRCWPLSPLALLSVQVPFPSLASTFTWGKALGTQGADLATGYVDSGIRLSREEQGQRGGSTSKPHSLPGCKVS